MHKSTKFLNFLESLANPDNLSVINKIEYAFLMLTEAENSSSEYNKLVSLSDYTSLVTFTGNDAYNTISDLVNLYKDKKLGNLIIDDEAEEPTMVSVHNYHNNVEITSGDYEGKKAYSVKITGDDDKSVDKVANAIAKLMYSLGSHGNGGHSYGIKFVPNSPQAKIKTFGWDGDGSDRIDIDGIEINDSPFKIDKAIVESEQEEYNESFDYSEYSKPSNYTFWKDIAYLKDDEGNRYKLFSLDMPDDLAQCYKEGDEFDVNNPDWDKVITGLASQIRTGEKHKNPEVGDDYPNLYAYSKFDHPLNEKNMYIERKASDV